MNVKCPNCKAVEFFQTKLHNLKKCNLCNDIFCLICFNTHLEIAHNDCYKLLTEDELEKYKVKEEEAHTS